LVFFPPDRKSGLEVMMGVLGQSEESLAESMVLKIPGEVSSGCEVCYRRVPYNPSFVFITA
jgi:hypothetical protein